MIRSAQLSYWTCTSPNIYFFILLIIEVPSPWVHAIAALARYCLFVPLHVCTMLYCESTVPLHHILSGDVGRCVPPLRSFCTYPEIFCVSPKSHAPLLWERLTDRMIDQMKIWKTPPLFFLHQHPAMTSMCGCRLQCVGANFNLLAIFNHFL
jgi:hypothetical protein